MPVGKKGGSECQNCYHPLKPKQMPNEIKNEYENLKGETRPPLWQFIGLVMIASLIIYGIFERKMDKKIEVEHINEPFVGDIYRYKTESNNYSTLLVIEVLPDSVYLVPNEYEFSTMSGINEIEVDSKSITIHFLERILILCIKMEPYMT